MTGHGALAADAGEVACGVGGGLGGVEDQGAVLPVDGQVDGLGAGAGGFLGLAEGAFAGGQGQAAVQDQADHQDQRGDHDDDERGDLPVVPGGGACICAAPDRRVTGPVPARRSNRRAAPGR